MFQSAVQYEAVRSLFKIFNKISRGNQPRQHILIWMVLLFIVLFH